MKQIDKKEYRGKRLISLLLALCLALLSFSALAEGAADTPPADTLPAAEAEAPAEPAAEAPAEPAEPAAKAPAEHTVFRTGDLAGHPILTEAEAAEALASLGGELGFNERSAFEPWRTLTDTVGNRYYVFRQMLGDTTVSGGAVKIITDPEGTMLGVVSSVITELPAAELSEGISAGEAEQTVRAHEKERLGRDVEVMAGRTEKIILPVNLELDIYSEEEKEESRFVWAVYTLRDDGSAGKSDLPFLAHYVTMDGTYLYQLPAMTPGDAAAVSGYNAEYAFQYMEKAPYTGEVTLPDGSKKEITVDLMRDSRTGMYYLGNPDRRIAVADCYPFLYEKGTVVLESSRDNTGWDEKSLVALYNYCRVWDYYASIGWKGGDGKETPILILKDFCDDKHEPIDNAAYAGLYYGWQVFLSSSANNFSFSLDVLAHEFTHCVTGATMTYNAYTNDYGAINEAISDIQGNLCEQLSGDAADPEWALGENSGMTVRSMSDPHRYQQPEYTWDLYYQPRVKTPTDINDRGGVHTNSSLLNRIAWLLYSEGGMTPEQSRDFWFAVDCTMVPGTDYPQLAELLPWVLGNLGMDACRPGLEAAIGRTALTAKEIPEAISADRGLVRLTLPDQELMTDGNWIMYMISLDLPGMMDRLNSIVEGKPGYEDALAELDRLTNTQQSDQASDEETRAMWNWINRYLGDFLFAGSNAAGGDGRTISMMCRPGMALPLLMRMTTRPGSIGEPDTMDLAVYVLHRWIDTGALYHLLFKGDGLTEEEKQSVVGDAVLLPLLELVFGGGEGDWLKQLPGRLFVEVKAGETLELGTEGLTVVKPVNMEEMTAQPAE